MSRADPLSRLVKAVPELLLASYTQEEGFGSADQLRLAMGRGPRALAQSWSLASVRVLKLSCTL